MLQFNVRAGHNWTLLSGKDTGETFEEIKDETEEGVIWDHPFDMHFKAKTIRGWPKFFVEVWQADYEGRYSIAGYGIGIVPFTPGQHTMQIKCWRPQPQGLLKSLAAKILGIQPELQFKDILFSTAERFGLTAQSTGTVEIDIGIIVKDFNLHGVSLYTEV